MYIKYCCFIFFKIKKYLTTRRIEFLKQQLSLILVCIVFSNISIKLVCLLGLVLPVIQTHLVASYDDVGINVGCNSDAPIRVHQLQLKPHQGEAGGLSSNILYSHCSELVCFRFVSVSISL
jgi:hypothetical protein